MHLPVLYRDENIVAVHKPSGLFVHRTPLAARNEHFAVQLLRNQIGQRVFPVHRLDRATSGVLLFALSAGAASELGKQFGSGAIAKTYLAVVRGVPTAYAECDHAVSSQPALTHFRRLATKEFEIEVDKFPTSRYSLVEARPVTGKRHQIRLHLKHLGHPIIGDINYGKGSHNRFFRERFGIQRLLLACTEMIFARPFTGEKIQIKTLLQDDFAGLLQKFDWPTTAS